MRIDKRIPFGFKGEWGRLYKLNNDNVINGDIIEYQDSQYIDIGQDIQFKYMEQGKDKTTIITDTIKNLITLSQYRIVITGDAYYNENTRNYESVVGIGDIVYFANEYWVVDKIEDTSTFTPRKQTIYTIGLKKIFDNIIVKEYKNA